MSGKDQRKRKKFYPDSLRGAFGGRLGGGYRPRVKAVFLDRDGTLNEEVHYLCDPLDAELIHGAAGAVRRLNQAGLAVVVVSNQSGLARGYCHVSALWAVERALISQLSQAAARVDAWYYCPHLPDGGVKRYSGECSCRKPDIGLVTRAENELGLWLRGSYMVGDRLRDVECGHRAGLVSVLVRSGQDDGPPQSALETPDHIAGDLDEAVDWILQREKGERGLR